MYLYPSLFSNQHKSRQLQAVSALCLSLPPSKLSKLSVVESLEHRTRLFHITVF